MATIKRDSVLVLVLQPDTSLVFTSLLCSPESALYYIPRKVSCILYFIFYSILSVFIIKYHTLVHHTAGTVAYFQQLFSISTVLCNSNQH